MRISLLVLTQMFAISLFAQSPSGVILYETTMHFERPEGLPPTVDFPEKRLVGMKLEFIGQQSLYAKDEEWEDPNADAGNGRKGRRWGRGSKISKNYYDFENDLHLEAADFFRKDFLVNDTIAERKWKVVASEQRDILGYTAMKAILVDTSANVEAWFTPQIPASFGPEGYYGLPGLILALTVDDSRVILAKKIDLETELPGIEVLSEGKSMDREEFEAMKEEKIEEMKKMWGGSKRRWNRG